MRTKGILTNIFLLIFAVMNTGCNVRFWDPAQVGRFRPVPKVNVILDSLGVAEETPVAWAGAEDPKQSDLIAKKIDYVFGSGDVVTVSIFELRREGALFSDSFVVTETGKISIPDVGVVQAAGLTERQLEQEISRILLTSLLKEPTVSVTLVNSQRRTFSILGEGVPVPSRYVVPRYDFRLADALATGGGISQFNISYIYVSRRISGQELVSEPASEEAEGPKKSEQIISPTEEMLEVISPYSGTDESDRMVVAISEMATGEELVEAALPEGFQTSTKQSDVSQVKSASKSRLGGAPIDKPIEDMGKIEWIFENGKWVPKQTGGLKKEVEKSPQPETWSEQLPESFEWDSQPGVEETTRVIKIPADKLLAGDPRYNIVIRPGDTIHVPVDVIGEFYVMGNTNYQGAIRLTGRPMTLKMAIASAGGLGSLAWPKHCEVVRRISRNKEEIVMVDLDKISRGEQPDFFIKPNDLVNIGTHTTSRWRAVLRNSFRATYGFGFIYDRNFGYREFGIKNPLGPFDF